MNELEAYQTSYGDILLRQVHGPENSNATNLNSKEESVRDLLKDKAIQNMLLGPVMAQLELMNNRQMEWMERLQFTAPGQIRKCQQHGKFVLSVHACVPVLISDYASSFYSNHLPKRA